MLIPFGIVLGTGVFFLFCAWQRNQSLGNSLDSKQPAEPAFAGAYRPMLFDPPGRWLTVKTNNQGAALAALGLHHPTSCSLEEGLAEAQEDKLFISPPINGWILVVGSGLPDPAEDADHCYRFLTDVSRKLGQVQFFSSSRALNYHAWALLEKGKVYRGYAWAGETVWNQGAVTAGERELDLACFEYGSEVNAFLVREALAANCEKVALLATRWGIDPALLASGNSGGRGIVGELSHSRPH
ncbi:MAG TPA: hypothetical protein VHB20_05520 [Verrucomicrobiae bacterium]|nr:hypothetical protein [Verrucomicrobiae bacterium]